MQVGFPLRKICPRLISQQNVLPCTKTAVCRLDGNNKKCQKILAFVEDQQQIVEFLIISLQDLLCYICFKGHFDVSQFLHL